MASVPLLAVFFPIGWTVSWVSFISGSLLLQGVFPPKFLSSRSRHVCAALHTFILKPCFFVRVFLGEGELAISKNTQPLSIILFAMFWPFNCPLSPSFRVQKGWDILAQGRTISCPLPSVAGGGGSVHCSLEALGGGSRNSTILGMFPALVSSSELQRRLGMGVLPSATAGLIIHHLFDDDRPGPSKR